MIRNRIKKFGNKNNYINATYNNEDKDRSYITKNSKNVFRKKLLESEYKKNKSTSIFNTEKEKK